MLVEDRNCLFKTLKNLSLIIALLIAIAITWADVVLVTYFNKDNYLAIYLIYYILVKLLFNTINISFIACFIGDEVYRRNYRVSLNNLRNNNLKILILIGLSSIWIIIQYFIICSGLYGNFNLYQTAIITSLFTVSILFPPIITLIDYNFIRSRQSEYINNDTTINVIIST